jgi:hypothetical protein
MIYFKKLFISKILVSLGLCVFVFVPLILSLKANHMGAGYYGHLIALPIMLWAVWGKKLHGTARSVRLMAFLGLAYTMGSYLATASRARIGTDLLETGHEHLVINGTVLVLLLLGTLLSIHSKES